jgi:hypothetical protein
LNGASGRVGNAKSPIDIARFWPQRVSRPRHSLHREARLSAYLAEPTSHQELMPWRKIIDPHPLFATLTDKLAAKAYSRAACRVCRFQKPPGRCWPDAWPPRQVNPTPSKAAPKSAKRKKSQGSEPFHWTAHQAVMGATKALLNLTGMPESDPNNQRKEILT